MIHMTYSIKQMLMSLGVVKLRQWLNGHFINSNKSLYEFTGINSSPVTQSARTHPDELTGWCTTPLVQIELQSVVMSYDFSGQYSTPSPIKVI